MQYAMLVYLNGTEFYALSKDEQNRIHRECAAWHDNLVRAGKSIGGNGLQPSSTAKTFRAANGKPIIMDGPFAETKEIIAGFEIFEFVSTEEATSTIKSFPGFGCGTVVELRPVVPNNQCAAV